MPPMVHKRLSIDELRSIVEPIAARYGVEKVYLFGSVARGDFDENSDYDFYVEADRIKSILEITELRLDLRDAIGSDIDIVTAKRLDPEFRENLMRDRVMIYG